MQYQMPKICSNNSKKSLIWTDYLSSPHNQAFTQGIEQVERFPYNFILKKIFGQLVCSELELAEWKFNLPFWLNVSCEPPHISQIVRCALNKCIKLMTHNFLF